MPGRFLFSTVRYLKLRRMLNKTQPVPGDRERHWHFSTWLITLGGLLYLISNALGLTLVATGCALAFAFGLLLAVVSALIETIRDA